MAIQQVKRLFSERLLCMTSARDYEVQCERNISIEMCRKFISERFELLNLSFK